MPSVLITGLNGFVATHTAIQFLTNGWNVRGTVRSAAKAEKLASSSALGKYISEGRVKTYVVEDLIAGDFSAALEGVDAVAHAASPWHFNGKKWADYRDPAVKGTTNVLEQAAKVASVQAIADVSSFAAVGDCVKPFYELKGVTYSEKDWLPVSEADCEALDTSDDPNRTVVWYCASKKFAELAGEETHKRIGAKYSFASILPPMIFGPAIHIDKAEDLGTSDVSTGALLQTLSGGTDSSVPDTAFTGFVDVRDVAKALYLAITKRRNGRFCLFGDSFDYWIIADVGRKVRPDLSAYIPQIKDGEATPLSKGSYTIDNSKARQELGMSFISLEKMVTDVIARMETLGVYGN